jgi:hypothetical protein
MLLTAPAVPVIKLSADSELADFGSGLRTSEMYDCKSRVKHMQILE